MRSSRSLRTPTRTLVIGTVAVLAAYGVPVIAASSQAAAAPVTAAPAPVGQANNTGMTTSPRMPTTGGPSVEAGPQDPIAAAVAVAAARSQAATSGQRAHVAELDTANQTTYENPDGTITSEFASGPIRIRQGTGWVPVDTTLVPAGGVVAPKATTATESFSARRFRPKLGRLLIMNTVLPIGKPLGPHSYEWRSLVRNTPDLPVGEWMRAATPHLTDEEAAAYDAPFPDSRFQAGARTFPDLAMVEPEMEGVGEAQAALRFWTEQWSGESFMAIGMNDPDVETMQTLRATIRGCPEPMLLPDVGHFVQEHGQAVARAALRDFGDL